MISHSMFAVKPLTGNASEFAKTKIEQLGRFITLTDSQKVKIEASAIEFAVKILNKDSITYQVVLPQATQEYKTALDGILTIDQKAQIIQKRKDNKNAAINKFKNN